MRDTVLSVRTTAAVVSALADVGGKSVSGTAHAVLAAWALDRHEPVDVLDELELAEGALKRAADRLRMAE